MAKKHTSQRPAKKHHRVKKLVKLALVAGAAYGVKRWLNQRKKKSPPSKQG